MYPSATPESVAEEQLATGPYAPEEEEAATAWFAGVHVTAAMRRYAPETIALLGHARRLEATLAAARKDAKLTADALGASTDRVRDLVIERQDAKEGLPAPRLPKLAEGFAPVDMRAFTEEGVLYWVNQTVLWPLGLALHVTKREDGTYSPWLFLAQTEPYDPIVSGLGTAVDEAKLRAFMAWLARRTASPDLEPR